MAPTEIRTQDFPGSNFIGPMEILKKHYEFKDKSKDNKSDNHITVKLVDGKDNMLLFKMRRTKRNKKTKKMRSRLVSANSRKTFSAKKGLTLAFALTRSRTR